MGRVRATQKYRNALNKIIKPTDNRIKKDERVVRTKKEDEQALKIVEAPQMSSAMFLRYNSQLGPPFHVLIDTNFVNFAIKNRIDLYSGFMDCLYAKTTPYVTDCVLGELEKMGRRFRLALKILKDPRVKRLSCTHKGIYADDCLVQRVTQHKCYIVATCDKDLRNRIRKLPGVPIMYIRDHRFTIERMPDAFGAPKF
uniref:rRNA-processing protein FCF1 homolog n=1 Tax=Panagrellus redivivus TaxID=6233 RepID=A0A7E4UX33_PANRE